MSDFLGSGLAFPLAVDHRGGIALARAEEDIEQAIGLILGTVPGERPMRPEFGCRLRDYVFRGGTDDTRSALAVEVRNALVRWDPRVDIHGVAVEPDPDDPTLLYIDITYAPKATNDRRNLVFPFYTIPDDGSDY